jgi:hypothetical protein
VAVSALAVTALAFLYLRAQLDPWINQGDPDTWAALTDQVARRQYAVSPMWPRQAPLWVQLGNVAQYADWQVALSLGPTVLPSVLRTAGTFLFLALAYEGATVLWKRNRRACIAILALLASGLLGVMIYLNLNAGPSIGYGILPPETVREARERDYFFVFGFWGWGMLAGVGAVSFAERFGRSAWVALIVAAIPIVLNWRAVTRQTEPERSLPRAVAEGVLGSAPANGVLFVVGDNDSYPLWYAQQVLGVRRDVTVVTIPLLPTGWYREQLAQRYGLLSASEAAKYEGRAATARLIAAGARRPGRPVTTAMTMTPRERHVLGASWISRGLVYVEQQGADSVSLDRAAAAEWAAWVERRVPRRDTRDAIDPVNSYFRRILDCPRQLAALGSGSDSTALDSFCNYR